MTPKQALTAIIARASGDYDNPALVAFGPLSPDILRDITLIAERGLAGKKPARFKCTTALRGVAYIHKQGGLWVCTLANGIPASFSYAGMKVPDMQIQFALEDADNDSLRLNILHAYALPGVTIEVA